MNSIGLAYKKHLIRFHSETYVVWTVEWYPKRDQNVCLNMVKKDQLCAIALVKRKYILKVFSQNGYYGNQPQPFEVVFYSIDATTSCSFKKQDLTVKQAYRVCLCLCSVQ